jgi:predicted kinase
VRADGEIVKVDAITKDKVLLCMVGLPYSGKSTSAATVGAPIVCPDAIRAALHGHKFIPEAEPMVWAVAKTMVRALFMAGHEVVVLDATNTTRARRSEWCGQG